MSVIDTILAEVPLPKVIRVHQQFNGKEADHIEESTLEKIRNTAGCRSLKPGQRIAITAGSRNFHGMKEVTRAAVRAIREQGAEPFLVPAMGSHGGATAEGQKALLASIGVTEETMGAPIISSMETDVIGEIFDGRPVFLDHQANLADGIFLINRVKAHTGIRGKYESGLMKMMSIGLGKQKGASVYHQTGYEIMPDIFESVGRLMIRKKNIVCGVAVLENGYGKAGEIYALDAEEIPEREPELLLRAKSMMPRVPFQKLDVMTVQKAGKNISGTGMDPFVTGRYYTGKPGENDISVTRLVLLRLTEESHGNCNGVGMADMIPRAFYDAMRLDQVYTNSLTAGSVPIVKIPMVMENDRLALKAAVKTAFLRDMKEVRMVCIEDTKHLSEYYLSENLREEAEKNGLEILSEPFDIPFDEKGSMLLFQ